RPSPSQPSPGCAAPRIPPCRNSSASSALSLDELSGDVAAAERHRLTRRDACERLAADRAPADDQRDWADGRDLPREQRRRTHRGGTFRDLPLLEQEMANAAIDLALAHQHGLVEQPPAEVETPAVLEADAAAQGIR